MKIKFWSMLLLVVMMPMMIACGGKDDSTDSRKDVQNENIPYEFLGYWYNESTFKNGSKVYKAYDVTNFKADKTWQRSTLFQVEDRWSQKVEYKWLKKIEEKGDYEITGNEIKMYNDTQLTDWTWRVSENRLYLGRNLKLEKLNTELLNNYNNATEFSNILPPILLQELRYQEYSKDFLSLIGRSIDNGQAWSTSENLKVSVNSEVDGNLYVYTANPTKESAVYFHTESIKKGSQSIYINKPIDIDKLYAMLFVADGSTRLANIENGRIDFNTTTIIDNVNDNVRNSIPQMYYYYLFENCTLYEDYDFNDVIIRVSTRNIDGKCTVDLMAAGTSIPTNVTYNGNILGNEIHQEFGENTNYLINTGSAPFKAFKTLGTISVESNADMTQLPLGIKVDRTDWVFEINRDTQKKFEVPLIIVVNGYTSGENAGKWFWPIERYTISLAYPLFNDWCGYTSKNTNWYQSPTQSNVYRW